MHAPRAMRALQDERGEKYGGREVSKTMFKPAKFEPVQIGSYTICITKMCAAYIYSRSDAMACIAIWPIIHHGDVPATLRLNYSYMYYIAS